MKELLKKWGIGDIDTIAPTPEGGGRTWFVKTVAKGDFVLKESDLMRSERQHNVQLGLSKTQIPVPLYVTTVEGAWYAKNNKGEVCCLYPKLPGHVVTEHYAGDAEKRALGFGQAIGLLHTCLQEHADINEYQGRAFIAQIEEWAIPCIRKNMTTVDACAIEQLWRDVEAQLRLLYEELPQQLIHRDAHTSNMLFSAGRLTGFLDFEMVTRGPRVFDVCYCASSMLVGGFEDSEKSRKWPDLFHSLARGYETSCPLNAAERQAMYGLFVIIELIFIAFWLDRHSKSEAKTAEHLLYWLATNRDALTIQERVDSKSATSF